MTLAKAGDGSVPDEAFNAVVDAIGQGPPEHTVQAADIDSQAAADGTVLTADGAGGASFEAGGGGSQSPLVVQVLTAAEVAAAWDSDYFQAAIALDGVAPGDLIQIIWQDANSLDQGISFDTLCAYLPGQSTANVSDNAARLNGVVGVGGSLRPYEYTVSGATNFGVIKVGGQAYALFNGDAAPTTGTLTLKMLVAAA